MYAKDINLLRRYFSEASLDGHELEELSFCPVFYQRIFFIDFLDVLQARGVLKSLWRHILTNLRSGGYDGSVVVVGRAMSEDFRHWEIFADIPNESASVAIDATNAYWRARLDRLDKVLSCVDSHNLRMAYVLPNDVLAFQGDWLGGFFFASKKRVKRANTPGKASK